MKAIRSIRTKYFPELSDRLLFLCGFLMLCSEIWKQYVLTFVLGGGSYNWWYFPFQLCSIPMYILLAYPWLRRPSVRRILLTFLMSYTLLGGIAVFADTSGLHYSYAPLTVHSYVWHCLLILLGIICGFIYFRFFRNKNTLRAFAGSTGLYLLCCAAAEGFNLSFDRFGEINMFLHQSGLSDAADRIPRTVTCNRQSACYPAVYRPPQSSALSSCCCSGD